MKKNKSGTDKCVSVNLDSNKPLFNQVKEILLAGNVTTKDKILICKLIENEINSFSSTTLKIVIFLDLWNTIFLLDAFTKKEFGKRLKMKKTSVNTTLVRENVPANGRYRMMCVTVATNLALKNLQAKI